MVVQTRHLFSLLLLLLLTGCPDSNRPSDGNPNDPDIGELDALPGGGANLQDEELRRIIYLELREATERAYEEARARGLEGEALKQYIFNDPKHRQRIEELERQVREKYQISASEAQQILAEGAEKHWGDEPAPK